VNKDLIKKDIKKLDDKTHIILKDMIEALGKGEEFGEPVGGKLLHLYKKRCRTAQSASKSDGLRIWYLLCEDYFQPLVVEAANEKGKEKKTQQHVELCIQRLKFWGEKEAYERAIRKKAEQVKDAQKKAHIN